MDPLHRKALTRLIWLPILLALVLFAPAGTLDWWQAWLFVAVFTACSVAITSWLAVTDPALLARRMRAGPRAETEPAQKRIMWLVSVSFTTAIVIAALDRRFGWSYVPAPVVLLGDLLIVLAYLGFAVVFRANTFASSTIRLSENQTVISTGPYARVRHPMYSAALLLILGFPLALGSWWALVTVVPSIVGLAWRILDEERFLSLNLTGYPDYTRTVRYRLLPYVW